MACSVCGYKGELRLGVCWYCAEAESIIAEGVDMYENGIGDRPAKTAMEKVRLLLAHSWLHRGLTPLALDGGDSAAQQALFTPEVLSTLQGESTPAHRK